MHPRLIAATLGLITMTALSAEAQVVRGLPVYNSGVNKFLNVMADIGWPNDAAGGGTAYGLTGAIKLGPLGLSGTVGTAEGDDGEKYATAGAAIATQIVGGPLMPVTVTLQGGVGFAKVADASIVAIPDDVNETRIPVGIGMAFRIPLPILQMRPWIAPRVQYIDYTGSDNSSTDLAVSGGIDFDFIFGLGVRVAYDKIFTELQDDPDVFGVGAYWRFGL